MSDHTEKDHPIAGYISAVVIGALIVMLLVAMSDAPRASIAAPFVIGWAIIALLIFTRKDSADSH